MKLFSTRKGGKEWGVGMWGWGEKGEEEGKGKEGRKRGKKEAALAIDTS